MHITQRAGLIPRDASLAKCMFQSTKNQSASGWRTEPAFPLILSHPYPIPKSFPLQKRHPVTCSRWEVFTKSHTPTTTRVLIRQMMSFLAQAIHRHTIRAFFSSTCCSGNARLLVLIIARLRWTRSAAIPTTTTTHPLITATFSW